MENSPFNSLAHSSEYREKQLPFEYFEEKSSREIALEALIHGNVLAAVRKYLRQPLTLLMQNEEETIKLLESAIMMEETAESRAMQRCQLVAYLQHSLRHRYLSGVLPEDTESQVAIFDLVEFLCSELLLLREAYALKEVSLETKATILEILAKAQMQLALADHIMEDALSLFDTLLGVHEEDPCRQMLLRLDFLMQAYALDPRVLEDKHYLLLLEEFLHEDQWSMLLFEERQKLLHTIENFAKYPTVGSIVERYILRQLRKNTL